MVVGRVAGAYGIKGWVRISSYTDPHENILDYSPWQLCPRHTSKPQMMADVLQAKPQGKGLVVQLAGIADRDAADALRGLEIRVPRAQLPTLDDGQFYWSDLEGLNVCLDDGTPLGHIDHLLDTGSADVMVIVGKQRVLVPFIYGDTVKQVDLDAGLVTVDWFIEDDAADDAVHEGAG